MIRIRTVFNKIKNNGGQRSYSTQRAFKEVSIKVPWGQVAGKWWEPYDTRPILSLHGWQDNCNTFDRIIPLLNKDVGYLTIDLPGHGYSSHLPKGINYHFTTYLIAIRGLTQYFNWPKISLMGHSMGGVISYMYSMLYPGDVDMLLMIDGSKPISRKNLNVHIAKTVDKFLKYDSFVDSPEEPPSYSFEEMKRMVAAPNNNSILLEYTPILLERNIAPSKMHQGKYFFTRDPRVKTSVSLQFSQDDLIEYAQQMTMPMLIVKAKDAPYWEPKENFYQIIDILKRTSVDCDFQYVPGTHHVHLNNPEKLADFMQNFIRRHNIEDRSKGGITDEILVQESDQNCLHMKEIISKI